MREKVTLPIKNKIIRKKNIQDIIDAIDTLKEENEIIEVAIKYVDGREMMSEDKSILEDRYFEEKEIKHITIVYLSREYDRKIYVYIQNYDNLEISDVKITSDSSEWLSQAIGKFEKVIDCCDNQNIIGKILNNDIIVVAMMCVLSLISSVVVTLILNEYKIEVEGWSISTLFCVIYISIFKYLGKMFPLVEIDINEKNNKSKKRRNFIKKMLEIICIPLILSFIYDILK